MSGLALVAATVLTFASVPTVSIPDYGGYQGEASDQEVTVEAAREETRGGSAVSYTHLTLPTICSV